MRLGVLPAALLILALGLLGPISLVQAQDGGAGGTAMPGMAAPQPDQPMGHDAHAGHDMGAMDSAPDSMPDAAHDAMPMEGGGVHDHAKAVKAAQEAAGEAAAEGGIGGPTVGIVERLGATIADATFLDSQGKPVNLRALTATVPTIVIPIYFRCPDVCNVLQGSFAQILPDVKLEPGREIQVVSVSFDPRENTGDAARAKRTYLAATRGAFPAEDWKFLTGDQQSINAFLDSIGYTVRREGGIFAHPVAVVAVAPGGKVVRYLYGSSFLPFDITMAGTEAAQGKTGLSVKRMLSFCYNYDPQGRRYVFDILRVSGFSIAGFVGLFIVYLVVSGRRQRKKKD
jgi:protein SCO1/2